ncbi:MAG: hypothetical protein R3324_11975, partial [Halobacteriales archaeon]|nr:hypothetical protein [Halobacteriales archaeon]
MTTINQYERGRQRGDRLRGAIRHNLTGFWTAVANRGIDRETVRTESERVADRLDAGTRAEIAGTAEAAGVAYRDLLAFNLFEENVVPDGCTVAIAAG